MIDPWPKTPELEHIESRATIGLLLTLLLFNFIAEGAWIVPDDTVHKGTSKRHKMDEKSTHFEVNVPPSIFDSKINKWSH